jgi:class 3 adenylate cyclase
MAAATTKYADAGELQIAYQVHGDGPDALIVVPGLISHIELQQEMPEYCAWLEAMAAHFKVIIFDKRGQGLSDRSAGVPGPEQRMDDITAIAAAEELPDFSLFGYSEGAAIAILYAASFPDRVKAVSVFGGFARFSNCDDYHFMSDEEDILKMVKHWGNGGFGYVLFPERIAEMREMIARLERACVTPNALRTMLETNFKIDVRAVLPEIQVPVLVMHRRDDLAVPVANGRYLADHLPNADYVEFAHGGHLQWNGDMQAVVDATVQFMQASAPQGGSRESRAGVLSTVLFTDIVGSSTQLAQLGDKKWRQLLDAHDRIAERETAHYQGRLIKNTGDGLLITFDGPARAIKCAQALAGGLRSLDIEIRCGLHIGEVEPRADDITGLAVHVAARVMDLASASQVLITRTLADLIAGSGISLSDHGDHELRGLPESWRLYAVQ